MIILLKKFNFLHPASLVSLGTLLGNDVFCSSKFLDEALAKATTFCKLEGSLIHYLEGSLSLWFVAYNIVVAKVMFTISFLLFFFLCATSELAFLFSFFF